MLYSSQPNSVTEITVQEIKRISFVYPLQCMTKVSVQCEKQLRSQNLPAALNAPAPHTHQKLFSFSSWWLEQLTLQ